MTNNNRPKAVLTYLVVNHKGLLQEKIEMTIKPEDSCFLPTIEVKRIIGCNNSFLKYFRENDLIIWGKIGNTYHYDLFTFKSSTTTFRKRISTYLGFKDT